MPHPVCRTWDSKSALLTHFAATTAPTVVIGHEAEAPRVYYSFLVPSGDRTAEIGLASSGLGTQPEALLFHPGDRLLVGHDDWITWVNLNSVSIESTRRLSGVFYHFIHISDDEAVVVHEIGALRVDAMGAVKWSVDTEVVADAALNAEGNLVLAQMEGPALVVSVDSGLVLNS